MQHTQVKDAVDQVRSATQQLQKAISDAAKKRLAEAVSYLEATGKQRGLKAILLACCVGSNLIGQSTPKSVGWESYAGDAAGQRYSPLTQISTKNVSALKLAWQYGVSTPREPNPAPPSVLWNPATPIVVGGVMYTPTAQRTIAALDPQTGREIWKYDLEKVGPPNRGVSYWAGDATLPPQILAGTADGRLLALDAKTGKLVPSFGNRGAIDLRAGVADKFPNMPYNMASPGLIYRNLIITGAQGQEDSPEGPAMDVRAWDLRNGKLAWTFHTIPHPGEPLYETWPKDYWVTAGTPANWAGGRSTLSVAWCFCRLASPPLSTTAVIGSFRTCMPPRLWRSMPALVKCDGTSR